jgi:hypothetical protein
MELRAIKEKRSKYLEALYKMVGGSPLRTANHHEILLQTGLSPQCSRDAFYYLQSEGLLQAQNPSGVINITHQGVKVYEATIARTDHDPVRYPGVAITNNPLHISTATKEPPILFGGPAGRLTPEQVVGTSPNLPKGTVLSKQEEASKLSPETDIALWENQFQEQKSQKHLTKTVMRNLKRALTSTLLETGVRFLLSKLRGLM